MLDKGFIGPIGDDLPSLIPLLIGLVMFFSTFTLTFNSFDERNQEFDNDLEVMRLSRTLQANSYIYSYDNFEQLCNQIGVVKLNYVAGLTDQAILQNTEAFKGSIFDIQFVQGETGAVFACASDKSISPDKVSDYLTLAESIDRTVVTRIFPIVLEDEKIVKPMHLVVVAWN